MDGGSDVWGTTVGDLQDGIAVSGMNITGTLKYYDDATKTIVRDWGEGYFLVLHFNADDWSDYTSVKVGLDPSEGTGLLEITGDPDKSALMKITNKDKQYVTIVATDGTYKRTQTFSLAQLTLSRE